MTLTAREESCSGLPGVPNDRSDVPLGTRSQDGHRPALDDVAEANDVAMVSKKIVASFGDTFDVDDRQLSVTCSIGASLFPIDGESPDELIRCADIAMYKAKESGRNNLKFYFAPE